MGKSIRWHKRRRAALCIAGIDTGYSESLIFNLYKKLLHDFRVRDRLTYSDIAKRLKMSTHAIHQDAMLFCIPDVDVTIKGNNEWIFK